LFCSIFFIAFLGVSWQGEFKNAIKKNRAKISSASKKSTYSLTSHFFFFTRRPLKNAYFFLGPRQMYVTFVIFFPTAPLGPWAVPDVPCFFGAPPAARPRPPSAFGHFQLPAASSHQGPLLLAYCL
jgi:hypothetical protein